MNLPFEQFLQKKERKTPGTGDHIDNSWYELIIRCA